MSTKALRICRECGLTAHTEQELLLFKNQPRAKYNKDNLCKQCASEEY